VFTTLLHAPPSSPANPGKIALLDLSIMHCGLPAQMFHAQNAGVSALFM
jgi:hypothetical protein